jgi:hypothetical protein
MLVQRLGVVGIILILIYILIIKKMHCAAPLRPPPSDDWSAGEQPVVLMLALHRPSFNLF